MREYRSEKKLRGSFAMFGFIMATVLLATACASDSNPLKPSIMVIPSAVTLSVGQSQIFTTSETHADILFQLSSDGGDWHQFVKATGQSYDAIQLTGVLSTGDKKVYLKAQVGGDNSKVSVAVIRIQ